VEDEQDGVDAVLNVEVGLALLAVAEDADAGRVAQQLPIEIDDMAMRVALAEDGDEAEHVSLEAEAGAVGRDQRFARHLRGAVEARLYRERTRLRRREDVRLAVDRSRRGEGDPLDSAGAHRFEDVKGRNG